MVFEESPNVHPSPTTNRKTKISILAPAFVDVDELSRTGGAKNSDELRKQRRMRRWGFAPKRPFRAAAREQSPGHQRLAERWERSLPGMPCDVLGRDRSWSRKSSEVAPETSYRLH